MGVQSAKFTYDQTTSTGVLVIPCGNIIDNVTYCAAWFVGSVPDSLPQCKFVTKQLCPTTTQGKPYVV